MDDLETGTFGALLELLNSGEAASWGLRGPSGDSEDSTGEGHCLKSTLGLELPNLVLLSNGL